MDLNAFTIDQLPFQTSEALPKDCAKYDVMMGAVPDEKDNTNPVPYMDKIFAAGGDSPVPPTPVGPKSDEIWYWGEYYDMQQAIEVLSQEAPYVGPAVVSNEKVGDKYIITFDGPVTKLGIEVTGEETGELYPLFMSNPPAGLLCNITSIVMPNSVTSIESFSFFYCSELTNISISNNVVSIGKEAFDNCTRLHSIIIPDSVTSIGEYAFQNCFSLTTLIIGDGVSNIGEGAFAGCNDLTSIEIPNSVTSIGKSAFYICEGLTSVTIPNSVTSIGLDAFNGCTSLGEVVYTGTIAEWNEFGFTEETSPFNYMSPVEYVTCSDGQTELVKNNHH